MVFFMGMAAITIDLGRVYLSYRQLQSASDAAALAGAYAIPVPGDNPSTFVTQYSAATGDKNAYTDLSNVSLVSGFPYYDCYSPLGITCVTNTAVGKPANRIIVEMQATVPLTFARVLGLDSMTISTASTAAMKGGPNGPFNVAIIVDTTGSMGSSDPGSTCKLSRIQCALSGIQVFLQDLSPCATNLTSCGTVTNGNVPNPVDEVSLFVFPGVTKASAPDDYCNGTARGSAPQITTVPYAVGFPASPAETYQVVGFSSDYKTSDATTALNTTSDLVLASAGGPPCGGLQSHGGYGTYYASVIYAAQAALAAQAAARPLSQNVMIILSDGDATATASSGSNSDFAATNGVLIHGSGSGTLKDNLTTYMSNMAECQQAVQAARLAATATPVATTIYTVSYGSEDSGCASDSGVSMPGVGLPNITPCTTMQQMALNAGSATADPSKFFSDYSGVQGAGTCVGTAQPTSNLNEIFGYIASDLTHARLIPTPNPVP
jgi:Flp pilus assembly protein TadG